MGLFEGATRTRLEEIRAIIQKVAPDAEEVISYSIPAYKYHGWLVYFSGGYAEHVSVSFPPHKLFETFSEQLKPYTYSKSTVQFPLDQAIPTALLEEMLRYKMHENIELEQAKNTN